VEFAFIFYIVFSFVLIALIIFTLFFIYQLREIRDHFKWQQSIIYLLGSVFVLVALSLAYFIYLHFSIVLAIALFIVLNGSAIFLLRRASSILRGDN
jgi:hypothetical protein